MAMSFSRPDPASPAQVADANFSTGRRGFDQGEVRDFLRMVSAELGRLRERELFLERELQTARATPDLESAQLDDETLTRLLGEETARVLNAARASANEIREKAEQAAARMLTEASDEAARRREEAEVEASRRRSDAAHDAEAELEMAKQQGREMVNEARAYRERVLGELSRRRELAREQIEQLVHGRDRLLQAFERARLVAVDVVAELAPLGEPDEYVNLQPTTGPVPVMVARSDQDDSEQDDDEQNASEQNDDEQNASEQDDSEPNASEQNASEQNASEQNASEQDEPSAPADLDPDEIVIAAGQDDLVVVDDLEPNEPDTEADTEPEAEIEEKPEPEDEAEIEDEPDDVVVDLFARLRHEKTDLLADDSETDDAETDAETDDETSDAETPFERRDADLTPLIVAGAKKLKRVLADEQNEVLDGLRRSDPVLTIDAILPWQSEHDARYVDAIRDELEAAARSGAEIGDDPTVSSANLEVCVSEGATIVSTWLVGPLRERVTRCVSEGAGDNAVITKKIRAVYREWKTRHIDEQLDHVVRVSHGRGVLAGIVPDNPVRWVADDRHASCADCDDNALEGQVAAGQPFPTGDVFAPAHPGCRCMLLPAAP